jgi:hypothetical protein
LKAKIRKLYLSTGQLVNLYQPYQHNQLYQPFSALCPLPFAYY